jgi:hypothetical protein
MKLVIIVIFVILSASADAQRINKSDKMTLQNIKKHISYLADDMLEGRRAGSEGELKAIKYISTRFKDFGLEPKGTTGDYVQSFEITDGIDFEKGSHFIINQKHLKPFDDFFPYLYTGNTDLKETAISPSLSESGSTWFINIGEFLVENRDNPHFDLSKKIREEVLSAAANKARAVLLINTSDIKDDLVYDSKGKSDNFPIPVIYLSHDATLKYLKDLTGLFDISVTIKSQPKKRTASNVVGFINNSSDYTIVLGAHIDHLGFGEDGNSMLRNAPPAIHNGADDNASGTAAMLELARLLSKSKIRSSNFMFIGFSGEELGLFGSKFFVENPTIPLSTVNYMINMDMIGRLNDSSNTVTIGGYGTSPNWNPILMTIKNTELKLKFDSSGTGPSDHTSFYRKDIPVLFFFTGLHTDYHRPSDDVDKINFMGTTFIVKYIMSLIQKSQDHGKLVFSKTREQQSTTSARFTVSLGIMPDYTFSGSGVRIDGVSDGRPAKLAGIITGDILIKIAGIPITSVESYMQILSKFKKGDSVKVVFRRGADEKTVNIIF